MVIPPAEARVVTPTDLNVDSAVTPLRISTAAFISTLEEKVAIPATEILSPIWTCYAIPIPPLITKAPFVGAVESVVFENVAIPVIFKDDESIVSVI